MAQHSPPLSPVIKRGSTRTRLRNNFSVSKPASPTPTDHERLAHPLPILPTRPRPPLAVMDDCLPRRARCRRHRRAATGHTEAEGGHSAGARAEQRSQQHRSRPVGSHDHRHSHPRREGLAGGRGVERAAGRGTAGLGCADVTKHPHHQHRDRRRLPLDASPQGRQAGAAAFAAGQGVARTGRQGKGKHGHDEKQRGDDAGDASARSNCAMQRSIFTMRRCASQPTSCAWSRPR